jgi:cell division protein FtsB
MASKQPSAFKRIATAVVIVAVVAFAVEGGEFGTTDLIRQSREKKRVTRAVDSLQHIVDSLKRYANAVEHDPATQERIAREMFGMVRGDKEILYRFTEKPDSGKKARR